MSRDDGSAAELHADQRCSTFVTRRDRHPMSDILCGYCGYYLHWALARPLSLLGFTMSIMCARRCHELHHKYPHFVPLRAGIHFRLASHRLLFFPLDCDSRCNSVGWQFKSNQSARHGRRAAGVSVAALVTLRRVFRSLEAFLALCCDRPTDLDRSGAEGPYVQGSSPPPPRRGRCAPL